MNIDPLTLESKFEVTKLKLYLQQHPEDSYQLAIDHFEDFLALVQEYKKLQAEYNLLKSQYSEFISFLVQQRLLIPYSNFSILNKKHLTLILLNRFKTNENI